MGKPDLTDDWMNPPKSDGTFVSMKVEYPRFLIERKRRLSYVPFEKWDFWAKFDSREDRDAELTKLREAHPAWLLRASDEQFPPMAYL